MSQPERLSIDAASRRLGLDPRVLRGWVRAGILPARRLPGGRASLALADVDALVDQRPDDAPHRINRLADHLCFGCGTLNPYGLQLAFEPHGAGVRTTLVLGRLREGWAGATHGGILATLLDEVMAWSLFHQDIFAVTAKLAINYRRPAVVGTTVSGFGEVVNDRGRLIEVAGRVTDSAGQVLADGTGTFVRVSAEQRDRWERLYGLKRDAAAVPAPGDG